MELRREDMRTACGSGGLKDGSVAEVAMVLTRAGLAGRSEVELLSAFCEACRREGLDLGRAVTFMGTLHPQFEERVCRWDYRECVKAVSEYSADEGVFVENWKDSALFHLMDTGKDEVRRRIGFGDSTDFYGLKSLRDAGHTDFIAFACRFGSEAVVGEIKCFYAYFTTVAAQGFSDDDIGALKQLVLHLALTSRCATMDRVAKTVASVYLGDDVADQVFHGEIVRGRTTRMQAVVWFSDLSDFTRISDTSDPNEIIPLLNDYSEAVISSILAAGGNVLKLIGDGTLAIFNAPNGVECMCGGLAGLRHAPQDNSLDECPPFHRGQADNRCLCGAACWRIVLWQHRQRRSTGFHGRRPNCQRGKQDRRALPRALNRHSDVLNIRSVAGCDEEDASRIGGLSFIARRFQVNGTVLAQESGTAIRGV
ncbi:class 3 adenylate cyclase [Rhizobium leguminosarum]